MAIVSVTEALPSGSGVAEHDSGNQYLRVFDVLTDSYDDNAITVANAADPATSLSVPQPYSYFTKGNDTDYGSIVTRIIPERDARYPLLWHVRVEYTVLRANTDTGQWPTGSVDITYRLPSVRIWGIPVVEVLDRDINDEPIVNSAGDPYQPRPEDVRYIKAIEVISWIRDYDMDFWGGYEDTVNSDEIWGREPGTLLMVGPPNGTRKVDWVGTYWEVRSEIHWDEDGWKKSIPDMGKNKLVNAAGGVPSSPSVAAGKEPITDKSGQRVLDNVPLDGSGQPLLHGLPWVVKDWTVKASKAWGPLNLPSINMRW